VAIPDLELRHDTRSSRPRIERPIPGQRAGGATRLSLTSHSPDLLRVHAGRDALRLMILVAGDAITVLLFWLLMQGLLRQWVTVNVGMVPAGQFTAALVLSLALMGSYGSGDRRRDPARIIRAAALGATIALWGRLWQQPFTYSAPPLAAIIALLSVGLLCERRLVDIFVRVVRPSDKQVMRAVVIGPPEQAARLIDHPAFGMTPWCHLAAFFDPSRHRDEMAVSLARLITEHRIDTIILAGRLSRRGFAIAIDVAAASGCQIFSLLRLPPTSSFLPQVVWRNGFPVVALSAPGELATQLQLKRLMDIVLSAAALTVLAPVLAVIAILIRRQSPGPVLFRQTRIGQGGRTFTILKFRTMVPDAEQKRAALAAQSLYGDGRLFKIENDPRITPIGAILRRTSLDELPQLWNVLRGDMSLVGPRPPLPSEVALYNEHHYARFDVKPGITGPWQVGGRNTIHNFESVVQLETAYIRRWSIWHDLELLCRTVPVVLSRRGAL
jgi:exopolysaccharide biosynthesis polyprenyl glycosylphosphotransferase